MMSVKRFKFRVNNISGSTDSNLTIPISMNFTPVDQSDIIKRDFIDKETDKSINPIIDFEKVRFIPKVKTLNNNVNQVEHLEYRLHLKENNPSLTISTYDDIGFVNDDVKFRRNNLKNSFLRLSFYDSDNSTNQNLLFFITLFTNISSNFLELNGNPKPISDVNVSFLLSDPIQFPENFAEGYYLYYDKSKFLDTPINEVYMRASYNNAKTGNVINLTTTPNPTNISNLLQNIHTKYILEKQDDVYSYVIDNSKGNVDINILNGEDKISIDLYEIQVL